MNALEKAMQDMKNGSTVAAVAVEAAHGRARDWPAPFRETALALYGLDVRNATSHSVRRV